MTDPKVSVVVPVYDVEAYLSRCLDSLLSQSLGEIEVIVVNDRSPDGSEAIIRRYEERDDRIRSIRHEVNRGSGGARNSGIEAATGRYVAFVDGDDWMRPDGLQLAYERAQEAEVPIVLFPALSYFEDEDRFGSTGYTDLRVPERFTVSPDTLRRICATVWTKLYDRELLVSSGVRFPENVYHQDEGFHFCFFAKTEPEVATLDERIYFYRRHASSAMGKQLPVRRDFPAVLDHIHRFLVEEGLLERYGPVFCGLIELQIEQNLPRLRFNAQEPFYRGVRDLLLRMDQDASGMARYPALVEVVEHDFQTYLQRRFLELHEVREDFWYRLGRQGTAGKLKRLVAHGLRRIGLYRAVKSLMFWRER